MLGVPCGLGCSEECDYFDAGSDRRFRDGRHEFGWNIPPTRASTASYGYPATGAKSLPTSTVNRSSSGYSSSSANGRDSRSSPGTSATTISASTSSSLPNTPSPTPSRSSSQNRPTGSKRRRNASHKATCGREGASSPPSASTNRSLSTISRTKTTSA